MMKIFEFKAGGFVACMVATVLLYPARSMAQATTPPAGPSAPAQQSAPAPAPDPNAAAKQQAQRQALGFLRALDMGQYAESYAYTSTLIRSKMSEDQFSTEVKKDRAGAGAKQSRKLMDATYTTTLANQRAGQYVVLQYSTSFVNKKDTVETLTMSYESSYWRVAGWYIK
jgi:hypothetical protein